MSATTREPDGYPIRVVAERTGLGIETLRQWERRYGFPAPQRNAAGARVYDEATVEKLELIVRALERGFRPSEVVERSPVEIERAITRLEKPSIEQPIAPPRSDDVDAVLHALARDDLDAVATLLRRAALVLGPRAFVTEHAAHLARRTGERWAEGRLDVRQEHALSDLLTTQLRVLRAAFEPSRRTPLVLLATLSGEQHALGLEMVAVYGAAVGSNVRVLGPDTPPDQIAAAARALDAAVVGLSISEHTAGPPAQAGVRALLESLPAGARVWAGGTGARTLRPARAPLVVLEGFGELDAALATL